VPEGKRKIRYGALLLVAALLDWLPAVIASFGGCAGIVRAAALAGLGCCIAAYLAVQASFVHSKHYPVGSGNDAFWADARGIWVTEALDEIARYKGPDETLAGLPEGVMLNYLSRRPNPTPYIFFMPFDVDLFGEDEMLTSFKAHPPTLIALVHKDTGEYGPRFFGKDYAVRLNDWIHQNYNEVRAFGDRPLMIGSRFGILLMRHKSFHR